MNSAPTCPARAVLAAATLALVFLPSAVRAGGFALVEENATSAGTCWSDAAAASDASTIFFNPAGLSWLQQPQVVAAGHLISTSVKFHDTGSTTAGVIPLTGGNGGNAGGVTPLPNLYYAQPVTRSWAAGVGLSVPWGLSTDYDAGWAGRYQALKSELRTVNLTAAASWRANDQFSLGLGVQLQRATVELSNAIDFGLVGYQLGLPGWLPGGHDGAVTVKGTNTASGLVAGLLYQPEPGTRIGISFRSKLTHSFNGDATFTDVPAPFAAAFPNQKASSSLTTPTTLSIHALQDWGAWRFTANATWWQFSSFKTLAVDFANPATPDMAQAQNWTNAGIYSFGAAYRCCEAFTVRFGAAYNPTPVPDAEHRTARIPDGDRHWLSLGATWQPAPRVTLQAGYVHLFFSDVAINNTDAYTHNLRGNVKTAADILSLQGTFAF